MTMQNESSLNYKQQLRKAAESGLLIFTKWGIVLILIWVSLNFFTGLVSGSANGTNAILYLNQAIEKGYLPKAVNGTLPPKEEMNEKASSNRSTDKP